MFYVTPQLTTVTGCDRVISCQLSTRRQPLRSLNREALHRLLTQTTHTGLSQAETKTMETVYDDHVLEGQTNHCKCKRMIITDFSFVFLIPHTNYHLIDICTYELHCKKVIKWKDFVLSDFSEIFQNTI